jgi:two-component system response regulator DesR
MRPGARDKTGMRVASRVRPIRVLLVAPMGLQRCALARVFLAEDDLEVVAKVGALDEAPAAARQAHPDVAILNVKPVPEIAAAVSRLCDQAPDCAILALTSRTGANRLRRALGNGSVDEQVRGLIDTDTTPSQLARYVRQAADGERVSDPRLLGSLSTKDNPMTPREREVLQLAALGTPGGEIADRLGLSTGTVRNYLSAIVRKTGARTLVEAARIAEHAGWL